MDEHARKTYEYNFRKISPELFLNGLFRGDITLEKNQRDLPQDIDILCGGFPCQPFSQAGFKKGFSETRGTLFFDIANIIKEKRPKAIFLENVRHLLKHDEGRTLQVILDILRNELNYSIFYKIMKASDYGLPTYRPRIYIVGFREDLDISSFEFPSPIPLRFTLKDIFQGECSKEIGYTIRVGGRGSGLYDRRNWDTYLVDGEEHRITSSEAKCMMGFPDDFEFPGSEAQALKQLGNSVAIDPIRMTGEAILNVMKDGKMNSSYPYQKIIDEFPALYEICPSIDCGPGWYKLIKKLSKDLEAAIKREYWEADLFPVAAQVKEKFGTLRFYMTRETDEMSELIDKAEILSGETCEVCGKKGEVHEVRGWLSCTCEEHAKT